MNPDDKAALQRVDVARYILSKRYKFARRTITGLVPRVVHHPRATLAVDKWHRLYINPEFVASLSDSELEGVLWHEVNHLLRHHPERLESNTSPMLNNLAADLEINWDLDQQAVTLPHNVARPEDFGLPGGLTAEEYYTRLGQQQPPQPSPQRGQEDGPDINTPGGENDDSDDDSVETGDGSSGPQQGKSSSNDAACGSGAGGTAEWEEPDPAPEVQTRVAREERAQAQDILDEVADNGYSRVSQSLHKAALEHLERGKHDWRQTLATEIRNALEQVRDEAEEYTFKRPSRRASSVPDVILPSSFRPVPDLAVIVDVSGSMDEPKVRAAIAEVHGILQRLAYPQFTAYAWNTQLVTGPVYIRQPSDVDALTEFVGGGTDMVAGIKYAVEQGAQVVVVLSDLECSWDDCPQVPLILGVVSRNPDRNGHRKYVPSWARCVPVRTD
ncbi:MAG: VWA-like domain-containing protein [Candidatus Caldarchaeum sp.]